MDEGKPITISGPIGAMHWPDREPWPPFGGHYGGYGEKSEKTLANDIQTNDNEGAAGGCAAPNQTGNTMQLNTEQAIAAEAISEWIQSSDAAPFTLTGYAGTGKTTTTVHELEKFEGRICFTAPTHKAVGVLASKGIIAGAEYLTIHALLGCRKQWTEDKQTFAPVFDKARWDEYDLIVIDEVSMVGEEIWGWILDAQAYFGGSQKVLCLGDPAQLPPVGDDSVSPAFNCEGGHLETIMRSSGIVERAATKVRENIGSVTPVSVEIGSDETGEVLSFEFNQKGQFVASMIKRFRDGQDAKLLAYRNSSVNKANDFIRSQLFPEAGEMPEPGEALTVVKTFNVPGVGNGPGVMLHAEATVRVESAEESSRHGLPCFALVVRFMGRNVPVMMLKEESKPAFRQLTDAARKNAKSGKGSWGEFYELMESFVDLRPGYATTVHKSQGSTFDYVYVLDYDLKVQNDHLERNMLRYVAFSRAAKGLYIAK